MSARASLRRRVIVAFVVFAAIVSVVYGAHAFLFAYVVEDELFERLIDAEAEQFRAALARGSRPQPRLHFVRYASRAEELPPVVRASLEQSPRGGEVFATGGEHFYVRRIAADGGPAGWLVADVGRELVVRPMRRTLLLFFAFSSLVVLVIAAAAGAWLARRSVQPLTRLVDVVERLDPDDLPREISVGAEREVRALAGALESSFERIRQFVARETHFTREVSHELRTPLTVISNSAELLERQTLDDSGRAQLARIREAARDAAMTVDALLRLAREESAHEPAAPLALLPLVEKLVVRHAPLLADKRVEVSVEIAPDVRVTAPPAALEIVVSNLLTNAFRYTPAGEVRVSARGASLTVADSGPGIPDGVREHVGEHLVRGANSIGHGIGLSLVRRVCEQQGWGFDLQSSDRGTVVTIHFVA